jgi:hypothetical protein
VYPEKETMHPVAMVVVFIFIIVFLFGVLIAISDIEASGVRSGKRQQVNEQLKRAISIDDAWYNKKGQLVYSGNLEFILKGKK